MSHESPNKPAAGNAGIASRLTINHHRPGVPIRVIGRKVCAVDGRTFGTHSCIMKGEFTAIIEEAPEGGYWAICPEVPGANGQGETIEDAKVSLREAIQLVLEDRLEDVRRGLPSDAIQTVITI
jgi:predicted RNase H-like HicB family nuclease